MADTLAKDAGKDILHILPSKKESYVPWKLLKAVQKNGSDGKKNT